MPEIPWTDLPPALRDHLFERLAERKITVEDMYHLKVWRESEPEAPEGDWFKDFRSFKICREGKYPKTFLLRGQTARGKKLEEYCRRNVESLAQFLDMRSVEVAFPVQDFGYDAFGAKDWD